MFEKLKLLQRILLGYTVPILLSILVAILVYVSALSVEKQVQVVSAKYSIVILTDHLSLDVALIGRASRGNLLVRDEKNRKALQDAEKDFDKTLESLKKMATDPRQQELLDKIGDIQNEFIGLHRQILSLVDQGREAEALQKFRSGETTLRFEKITSLIEEFDKSEYEILNGAHKAEADSLRFLIIVVWAGALLSAILAIAIGFFIASRITGSIVSAVNAISSTSTEISATVEQHERTSTQQAASVNETTSTMTELATSSRTTAEQAEAAATAAQKALVLTAEGGKTVKEAVDGMNRLKERVEAIGQQILRLSEQTGQIGNIANLVKDLAGQTNMLALNAAVEAARAGEQGKGFAVVAAEIRKLADQSRKSSEQIAALIAEIQKSTNTTVMVAEEGTKTAESVLQMDQKVVEAFTTLATTEAAIFENVQQAMLNAKQQAEALRQVDEAMNNISAGAKDTAAGISQTRVGIQKLDETAKSLKGMV